MPLVKQIKEKARTHIKTIVFPESYDERMLFAAQNIVEQGLAKVILLGNPEALHACAVSKGIHLAEVEIIEPACSPKLAGYVEKLMALRKSKGLTREQARELLCAPDHLYFAGMMVREGDADGQTKAMFSVAPFGLPGRLIMRVCLRMPATAREMMALAVFLRLSMRITSPKPGSSRSTTRSVASGVTSRGETPVPPVVRIRSKLPLSAHSMSFSEIITASSGITSVNVTVTPRSSSHPLRAGPLPSALSPVEHRSLRVNMAARMRFSFSNPAVEYQSPGRMC